MHVAAGGTDGYIVVLDADSLSDAAAFTVGYASLRPSPLQASTSGVDRGRCESLTVESLAFSPDDSLLAVGGTGGIIEILVPHEGYRPLHALAGHSAAVLHLDWSADGRHLQSCCARCELRFWDAAAGSRVADPASMRDVVWASWTLPLGWPVQGVYPNMSDGSDITSAHRSPDGRLLVTSDDFRKINLFRCPNGPTSAACRSGAAHAAHVSMVRFLCDGKHLVSVGGADLSIMVWRVA